MATDGHRWSELVVICATTPWEGSRLLDRHVASELARYAPVLYVEPPRSPITPGVARAERLRGGRLRLAAPNVALLSPLVLPGKERPGMKQATLALTRRAMCQAVAELGSPSVRAVIVPSLNPLFGACGERIRVFYAKDDYLAGAELMGIAPRRLRKRALRQPADADLVVAASSALAEHYRALGHDALAIPNGVDPEPFMSTDDSPAAADVHLPSPIAGFVGLLSDRLDLASLEAVPAAGHSLLLVGARQATFDPRRVERLLARPNVQWAGARPFEELPGYLKHIDVGLVPYLDSAFNRASFPLKTLEYLAAGRGVVASDLPAVRWLDTDLIRIAEGPTRFAAAVADALAEPRTPDLVVRRRGFAAAHSWSRRVAVLADALGFAPLPARGEPVTWADGT